jgi:hypothetical protein
LKEIRCTEDSSKTAFATEWVVCALQLMVNVRARLEASRDRVDGHRLHRTRGWKTAVEADIEGIRWTAVVQRETLYAAATCAIEASLLDSLSERARRKAVREAILDTLQCFCVITRTRDGRPWSAQCAEDVS